MKRQPIECDELLTPAEVGALFGVDPKRVRLWAQMGWIPESAVVWTLGGPQGHGHRRYRAEPLRALLAAGERP